MTKLNIEVTIIFVQQTFVVWHHISICKRIPFVMTVCYIHVVRILTFTILRITVFQYFCCCLVIFRISKSTTSINHTAKRRIVLSTRSMQHERCHCSPKWIDDFFTIFILLVNWFTLFTHHWLPSRVFLTKVLIRKFCPNELVQLFGSHMTTFLQPKYNMHIRKPLLLEFNGMGSGNHLLNNHFNTQISNQLLFLELEDACHQIWSVQRSFSILEVFLYSCQFGLHVIVTKP